MNKCYKCKKEFVATHKSGIHKYYQCPCGRGKWSY